MIELGEFKSHSGLILPWKIDCDDFSDNDIRALASIIASKFNFSDVYGIPRGGTRLADALSKYSISNSKYPLLIADDVLTTGLSMEQAKQDLSKDAIGVVIFSRKTVIPNWIHPIFTLNGEFQ